MPAETYRTTYLQTYTHIVYIRVGTTSSHRLSRIHPKLGAVIHRQVCYPPYPPYESREGATPPVSC